MAAAAIVPNSCFKKFKLLKRLSDNLAVHGLSREKPFVLRSEIPLFNA